MNKVFLLILGMGVIVQALEHAPQRQERAGELHIVYNDELTDRFNALSHPEQVVVGLLYQSMLPFQHIFTAQLQRHGGALINLFAQLYAHRLQLQALYGSEFVAQVRTFYLYLLANHGQYAVREEAYNKRTPARLGLTLLTPERLLQAGEQLGLEGAMHFMREQARTIFDVAYEPTLTTPQHPELSAVNIPTRDTAILYSIKGPYGADLERVVERLAVVVAYAAQHPEYFDTQFVESIRLLRKFFITGERADFEAHSRAWLKSRGQVGYVLGFIECYRDPLQMIDFAEGDVVIKERSRAVDALAHLLPELEHRMPIAPLFKRDRARMTLPNVALVDKLVGVGELGPAESIAAYCLPNDNAIRAHDGSKQVIYRARSPVGIDRELLRNLSFLSEQAAWLRAHDSTYTFLPALYNLHVFLHETLGHGSGKYGMQVRQAVPVTADTVKELLLGYFSAMEELRAEINALYVSLAFTQELVEAGQFTQWEHAVSLNELREWFLLQAVHTSLRRLLQQSDVATEITGAHALADCTIVNYLCARGMLEWVKESIVKEGVSSVVLGARIVAPLDVVTAVVAELVAEVQRIVSTGDGEAARALIETYGRPLNQEHRALVVANHKAVMGDIKLTVTLTPHFEVTVDADGETHVHASWPEDLVDLARHWN